MRSTTTGPYFTSSLMETKCPDRVSGFTYDRRAARLRSNSAATKNKERIKYIPPAALAKQKKNWLDLVSPCCWTKIHIRSTALFVASRFYKDYLPATHYHAVKEGEIIIKQFKRPPPAAAPWPWSLSIREGETNRHWFIFLGNWGVRGFWFFWVIISVWFSKLRWRRWYLLPAK